MSKKGEIEQEEDEEEAEKKRNWNEIKQRRYEMSSFTLLCMIKSILNPRTEWKFTYT